MNDRLKKFTHDHRKEIIKIVTITATVVAVGNALNRVKSNADAGKALMTAIKVLETMPDVEVVNITKKATGEVFNLIRD